MPARRQLGKSQLAGIAAKFLPELREEAKVRQIAHLKQGPNFPVPPLSVEREEAHGSEPRDKHKGEAVVAADIVHEVRAAIACLAEADDRCARIARALDAWLRGTELEASLGLIPGWRQHVQQAVRQAALDALLAIHPALEARSLARLIVAGIQASNGERRPDGEAGHFHDLAKIDPLSERSWRRLVAEARGQMARTLATNGMRLWSAPNRR